MTNLTIAIDEDVLRRARIRALEEGSTVNALLREFLVAYATSSDRVTRDRAVLRRLMDRAKANPGDSGGRSWTREDLYEDRLSWPR